MTKYKCIVVDDEPLAHSVLEKFITKISSLSLVYQCHNAFDAVAYLHQNSIDIMFLDINMPDFTGLEMLKTLQNPPKVILTTAYSEYAVESYEYNVVDYLLKPFSFDRFLKAINKATQQTEEVSTKTNPHEEKKDHMFVKADKTTHKINFEDITYLEAYGNYIKIHTTGKMIMVYEKMHELESRLPSGEFVRVHKSFIISLSKIDKIVGNRIFISGHEIPIGQTFKKGLEDRIN